MRITGRIGTEGRLIIDQSFETVVSRAPLWAVLVSALAVIPLILLRRRPNLREAVSLLAGVVKLLLVLSMLPTVLAGKVIEFTLFPAVAGVPIQFRIDGLGMLFALVASSLWILTTLYAIGYMRGLEERAQTRFYSFFALSLSATLGVAFAGNLLTLYIFYELLSLATYPLVTHHQNKKARSGGRKYLLYLLGTSVGFALPAMLYTYHVSGGLLTFSATGVLAGNTAGFEAAVLLLLFVFGFSKAGIMPFHSWLPGAMVAPTPVSALLHAVAVVKVGVFCILRVITGVFGIAFLKAENLGLLVSYIAAFTVITASLIALSQDNLKRRLAFSTIGQLSYIVLGASLLTAEALTGSMLHIAMHAYGKITLFFCAGAIYVATGKKNISEMAGIGWRMPVTMLAFLAGAMSVIGLPPTGGFISKWYLVLGAVEGERFFPLAIYLISSLLNAAYFLPIVYQAFFCREQDALFQPKWAEAPRFCLIPLGLTALVSVLLFFQHDFLVILVKGIAGALDGV